jgi:putative transposase
MFGYKAEVVKVEQSPFRVLPKRWIVERTFGWLNWPRRLNKDYELRHPSAKAMIYSPSHTNCSEELSSC